MLRGIYSAASGMMANQLRSEALTNNLANLNSTGYKSDNAVFRSFPDFMIHELHKSDSNSQIGAPSMAFNNTLGNLANGVYTQEMIPDFHQGDLTDTGNPLDFAINDQNLPMVTDGNGKQTKPSLFFAIQKNNQTSYTRNGNFTLDAQNQLVTADGSFVLDDQGNKIVLKSDQFKIDEQGNFSDEQGNPIMVAGRPLRIQLVQIDNPYDLVKGENNAFLWQGQGQPQPVTSGGYQIKQGMIERSNVNAEQTMVDLMETQRSFEANQKVLSAYNETLDKLFDLAKV